MKFNFPKYDECVVVELKLNKDLFLKIKEIANKEEVLRQDAIPTLLEAAVQEYFDPEYNQYQRKYYQEKKDILVEKKRERRKTASPGVKEKEKNTKHQYYLDHPEIFNKENGAGGGAKIVLMAFCQNVNCKIKYPKDSGVKYLDFLFCSDKCRDEFKVLPQDIEETESLTSSRPIDRRFS